MSVRVFAPAKINLTLEVGRPRVDGRHPLQSVVAFADVGDWVEAAPAETLSLELSGPFAAALQGEGDNLVLRAARALQARFDVKNSGVLKLEKNLPIASGIGGGSSDAAAALKALAALWNVNASEADLIAIAATLGADVPVCIASRSAYMTGTGEMTAPMRVPPLHAVLINPLQPLSTGAVYKAFDAAGLGGTYSERAAPVWTSVQDALQSMRAVGNDLSVPAEASLPVIGDILHVLRGDQTTLYAALSGSGATCFAIVNTQNETRALAAQLKQRWPAFWIAPTQLGGEP